MITPGGSGGCRTANAGNWSCRGNNDGACQSDHARSRSGIRRTAPGVVTGVVISRPCGPQTLSFLQRLPRARRHENWLDERTRLVTPSGGPMRFSDRSEAGRQLAQKLSDYANHPDVVILALPRGGVPVGSEIATALNAPLDIIVVRKLGVPDREELAMGAIASGDVRVLNQEIIDWLQIPPAVND